MSIVLALVGLLALLVAAAGALWFVVNAFRTSVWWGIFVCMFTPAWIRFSFKHWDMARLPLGITAAGLAVAFGCGHFLENRQDEWGEKLTALTSQLGHDPAKKKFAYPPMFEAQKKMELQIKLAALQKRENDLLERKAELDPANRQAALALTEEINKYNDDLKPLLQEMRDRGMVAAQ